MIERLKGAETKDMPDQDGADVVKSLIAVLREAVSNLTNHVQSPYRFRFVSSAQAVPYTTALALWVKGGEVGPPPDATIGEVRASIYSQSESASELRAFAKVASVAAAELASAAVAGLEAGQIIVTYSALRGFIERTAHATALAEALKSLNVAPIDGPLTPVLDLSEVIHKALYATHREWTKVIDSDLRKTSSKDVKYAKKENLADALPDNILKAVDKLEKRIPGTRLVYEIFCEYLHPNVGDLWGATLEGDVLVDKHGTRHLVRTIGLGMKTFKGLPEQAILRARLFDVCADIIPQMSIAVVAIESIADKATRLTRRYAHGVVKNNRKEFLGDDICPCLSGLTVAACTGLRSS